MTESPDPPRHNASQCGLPAAPEAVEECRTFPILRGAFNGFAHFEQFQASRASRATSCPSGRRG